MVAMPETRPTKVTIRVYDVGFGDCFLLTFHYSHNKRHILIDFGSTAAAKKGNPLDMLIAQNIAEITGGKLHAVVATHRHADHISGFTTRKGKGPGDIIRKCARAALILQPWTEDPKVAPKATAPPKRNPNRALALAQVRSLDAMQGIAAVIAKRARRIDLSAVANEPDEVEQLAEIHAKSTTSAAAQFGIGEMTREKLGFLGQTNLKNLSAVKNLMTMSSPKKHCYAYANSLSGLEDVLPGVDVEVLGPPTVAQSKDVLNERRSDQAEFWMLAAAATKMTTAANKPLFPNETAIAGVSAPRRSRWFIRRMRQIHAQQLFELVRIVDDALNNTSLILLFTIGKTKLLFPGDAQIENWQWALRHSERSKQILKKLEGVNLYKVGHHGSRNATPKTLWKLFKNRRKGLQTIMSTKSGKFPGRAGSGTEVPRETLMKALAAETKLTNTQEFKGTKNDYFRDIVIPLH
jgi:hypothetical protein